MQNSKQGQHRCLSSFKSVCPFIISWSRNPGKRPAKFYLAIPAELEGLDRINERETQHAAQVGFGMRLQASSR